MNDRLYYKKGQIDTTITTVITLIVGVGVAVLILIFIGTFSGQTYELLESDIDEIGNNIIIQESFNGTNQSVIYLDHAFIQEGTLSIVNNTIVNSSISLTNFTVDYDAGSIILNDASEYANIVSNTMFANYTWGGADIRNHVRNSIVSGFSAIEQAGNYLPLIVLGVVIAIVLSLVIGYMAFGKGSQGGSAL